MLFFCLCFSHAILHQILLPHETLQIRLQFFLTRRLVANRRFQTGYPTAQIAPPPFRFAQLIIRSRFPDQVHARIVLTAFVIGVAAQLAFAWGLWQLSATWVHSAQMLTVWLFLAPVFITVAHRLIPFFTASVVPTLDAWRPLWLLVAMNGVVIAHALLPGADGTIAFWSTVTGRLLVTSAQHAAPVTDLAFGPDGTWLVSSSRDGTLRSWRVVAGN